MNIYGIRDRMIDWFIQPPFFAPNDNSAMASLAEIVNGETRHAITQAPHHFELWRLGEVNEETGQLVPSREYLADASSLLRGNFRPAASEGHRDPASQQPAGRSTEAPGGTEGTS